MLSAAPRASKISQTGSLKPTAPIRLCSVRKDFFIKSTCSTASSALCVVIENPGGFEATDLVRQSSLGFVRLPSFDIWELSCDVHATSKTLLSVAFCFEGSLTQTAHTEILGRVSRLPCRPFTLSRTGLIWAEGAARGSRSNTGHQEVPGLPIRFAVLVNATGRTSAKPAAQKD